MVHLIIATFRPDGAFSSGGVNVHIQCIYIYIICRLIKLSDNKLFSLHSVAVLLACPVQLEAFQDRPVVVDNKEGAQLLCKQKGTKVY